MSTRGINRQDCLGHALQKIFTFSCSEMLFSGISRQYRKSKQIEFMPLLHRSLEIHCSFCETKMFKLKKNIRHPPLHCWSSELAMLIKNTKPLDTFVAKKLSRSISFCEKFHSNVYCLFLYNCKWCLITCYIQRCLITNPGMLFF